MYQTNWVVYRDVKGASYLDYMYKRVVNGGIVSADTAQQPLFFFSGIPTCQKNELLLDADRTPRQIINSKAISIYQNDSVTVEMYRNKEVLMVLWRQCMELCA